MAVVWGEGAAGVEAQSVFDAQVREPSGASALLSRATVGLADLDGRVERLLATIEGSPAPDADTASSPVLSLAPTDEPAPADLSLSSLRRQVDACVAVQRQQAEALRVEFAAQRSDLRRWLNDGLAHLKERVDQNKAREPSAADPLLVSTSEGLAECREDLAGIVAAVRSVSVEQRAQTDAIASAAATANLRLREELEQHLATVRFELERRIDRIERGVVRRSERQRQLLLTVAAGLGLVQVVGVVTVLIFG